MAEYSSIIADILLPVFCMYLLECSYEVTDLWCLIFSVKYKTVMCDRPVILLVTVIN